MPPRRPPSGGRVVVSLSACALLLAPAARAAKTGDWAVPGAPYRVVVQAAEPPAAPDAGWQIRLQDFGTSRPDMRDVVLLDAKRKEIALDAVWRGAGKSLLLLAQSMPADKHPAYLYFGGNSSRRLKSWTARRSLLLETRRLPAGAKIAGFAAWQEAWKKSANHIDGAAFVSNIFHGGNPFGVSDHYLSRYTGVLKTGDGGSRKFYTLCDDVCYVTIAGRAALQWTAAQPPMRDVTKVPVAEVKLPKDYATVDYCHAVADGPAGMVLGWQQDEKLDTVPPAAWVQPGSVTAQAIESHDGAPVPVGTVTARRYLGFGGEWVVIIHAETRAPEPWQAEWQWPDGRIDRGPETTRLWMSLDPVQLVLRLRNGAQSREGAHAFMIPRDIDHASPNNPEQLAPFLELLAKEDPQQLAEPARRAAFVLAAAFLTTDEAARHAEAWLAVAKPTAGAWITAQELAIDFAARKDPQRALDRLLALDPGARQTLGRTADLLELDLRVFRLNDPSAASLVEKLRKSSDAHLRKMAEIRMGDYHLLNNRTAEAAACYRAAAGAAADARAPVIDRAHSLALEPLLEGKRLDDARAEFARWELQRPAAKLESDQLYWRARVHILAGDCQRALQDLQTNLKTRPGSPEEIDVLFWQGRTLKELGRTEEARRVWQDLIRDYPKHERAQAAKLWLDQIHQPQP